MTFKHKNFEDSETMRSLVKLAREKGLVDLNPIQEHKDSDYTVSDKLVENVLRLCAGLREQGLEKFANELESQFVNYKKEAAANIYSKSDGEDIINEAHPKGSVRLTNLQGDAIVETIIDQHLKLVDVSLKNPTGKLAYNRNILNSVKKVLAQQVQLSKLVTDNLNIILNSVYAVKQALDSISWITRPSTSTVDKLLEDSNLLKKDVNFNTLNQVYLDVMNVKKDLSPKLGGFLGGLDEDTWNFVSGHLNTIHNSVFKIQEDLKTPVKDNLDQSPENKYVTSFYKNLKDGLNTLNVWRVKIETDPENSPQDKKIALNWLDKKFEQINNLKSSLDKISEDSKYDAAVNLTVNFNKIKQEFEPFKKEWIG